MKFTKFGFVVEKRIRLSNSVKTAILGFGLEIVLANLTGLKWEKLYLCGVYKILF